jgi:oligopeptidase B
LIGSAYVEVPYVDVLKTTSNPNLPLTVLEYDEFGNPRQRIQDLETLLRVSPVDTLPSDGAPGVFVVARTSTNDREVLAYESVKWITRLRGYPIPQKQSAEKFLHITEGHGHFINGDLGVKQKAEDFLLLQKGLGLL